MAHLPQGLDEALAGRYRITGELGAGGMATVYRADDLRHHREVALKVLRRDVAVAIGTERFLLEVRVMAKLSHPHILPLLDSGEAAGTLWIAMPLVAGESLRRRLERGDRIPPEEAIAITRQVGSALDFAHRHQVVHRDIKPENILIYEGEAMVADFGIALVASAARNERLTDTGMSPGTLTYMSPEQLGGLRDVDGRADQYALAAVLCEMLTGSPPVIGTTPALRTGPGLPSQVAQAVRRALEPDRDRRFGSVEEFLAALGPSVTARTRSRSRLVVGALVGAAAVLALAFPIVQRLLRAWAQAEVPRVASLAAAGRFGEAYHLAVRLERRLGDDTTLARLMPLVADRITIETTPADAEIWLQPFAPDSAGRFPDSTRIGVSPLRDFRLPRMDQRLVVRKTGFAPIERMVSSAAGRAERDILVAPPLAYTVVLHPADSVPDGMVSVEGGRYELVSPDMPRGLAADLAPYFIDRMEVSNAQFREFIRAGGYTIDSLWATSARSDFVDRTGQAAPRSWSGQDFPAGRDHHPVTDLTWFEALAYCMWRGGSLPSVYQWEKAARNGEINATGNIMPWGLASGPVTRRANFSTTGTMPVDAHPFGVSPWGAWAMAGNVKEWTVNGLGSGRVVAGGSWEDPSYLFSEYSGYPSGASSAAIGLRCVRMPPGGRSEQEAAPLRLDQRTPVYRAVDEGTFRGFLDFYRYDRGPLDARIISRIEGPDWIQEKIRYNGGGGDSVLAYLYLPRRAAPPFQTMVFVPGGNAFIGDTVGAAAEWLLAPLVRGGRALFAVVLAGMTERERPRGDALPAPASVEFRDRMVLHSTELRRGLDYLETRAEFDRERLVYVGLSFGAGSRLVLAGTDDRWRGVIFVGAGIDERIQPTLPEASNINFAAHLRPPKLFINGKQDEEHPWFTRALPLWNLLHEPKKLVLVEGAGHVPPPEALIPAASQWLDELLGPVKR